MTNLHQILASIHPGLPALALAVVVGGLVWGWRRLHPSSFEALPRRWQALPALVISAILATITNGGDPVKAAIDTVIASLLAVGGHHVQKRLRGKENGSSS